MLRDNRNGVTDASLGFTYSMGSMFFLRDVKTVKGFYWSLRSSFLY